MKLAGNMHGQAAVAPSVVLCDCFHATISMQQSPVSMQLLPISMCWSPISTRQFPISIIASLNLVGNAQDPMRPRRLYVINSVY